VNKKHCEVLKKNVLSRFGVPLSFTTDNGTQFTDKSFRKVIEDLQVKHH